ncbi:carotenoid oxygenase [Aspergillus ambiguus]|uniref:carotenoid oxygenase family protein n=1 Tax=Aspergillus ambiguus TaxID=176160 RepID=UPI003CCCEF6D
MASPAESDRYASKWTAALRVPWATAPGRIETELPDLVVCGEIPKEIDGTFYRIMADPFYPPSPENSIPIEGDGHVSAFRIHNGQVDMKTKYVDTERLKLERKANRRLFGLYRNPFTHHPCVRAAVDSTANTNLVYWAGRLLALKEVALPYQVDPDTLDTIKYDPFEGQITAKTFTAHPKVDPFTNDLVVFGYEAKGLASLDIVIYALDHYGNKKDEKWIKAPWCAMIHDCAITPNFIILVLWPFEADMERLKAGRAHWAWNHDRAATFIVTPRRSGKDLPKGWKEGESRIYDWDNCIALHTAGAWEEEAGGVLYMESSRVFDNELPFFPPADGPMPPPTGKADFVRWKFDLSQPSGSRIPAPQTILDLPSEFPRIDERFMTKSYSYLFLDVVLGAAGPGVIPSLNGLAMVNTKTGRTEYYNPGKDCHVEEPVFIPRQKDAPEGDGWVLTMVERKSINRSDLVVLDTRDFSRPVALVQLPYRIRGQIHGNWVPSEQLGERRSLTRELGDVHVSGRGALEPEY